MGKLIATLIVTLILSAFLMFVLTYVHITFVCMTIRNYYRDIREVKGRAIFYVACIIFCHLLETFVIVYSFIVPAILGVM